MNPTSPKNSILVVATAMALAPAMAIVFLAPGASAQPRSQTVSVSVDVAGAMSADAQYNTIVLESGPLHRMCAPQSPRTRHFFLASKPIARATWLPRRCARSPALGPSRSLMLVARRPAQSPPGPLDTHRGALDEGAPCSFEVWIYQVR